MATKKEWKAAAKKFGSLQQDELAFFPFTNKYDTLCNQFVGMYAARGDAMSNRRR